MTPPPFGDWSPAWKLCVAAFQATRGTWGRNYSYGVLTISSPNVVSKTPWCLCLNNNIWHWISSIGWNQSRVDLKLWLVEELPDPHRNYCFALPKSLNPKTFALPKSLNPRTFALPKSLNPKTFALPKSLNPKTFALPKSLNPITFALPKSLNPKTFALPKSLSPKTFALPKSPNPKPIAEPTS